MLSPSFVVAYSLQVGVLAAVAWLTLAATARWVPLVRLGAWRLVLVLAWLLPAAALWPAAPRPEETPSPSIVLSAVDVLAAGMARQSQAVPVDWPFWLTVTIVGGAALRLLGLGLAAGRIRRRVAAMTAVQAPLFDDLRARLDVDARLVCDASVTHPFTIGHRRATVVVPVTVLSAPDETQRAVFLHELLHVARHDWRSALAEEIAAAPLWFHPAAWVARRELQQAREEIVDGAVVARLGGRRRYLELLVAFAERPSTGLALSLPIVRTRQLSRRISTLLSEVSMSKTRLTVNSALFVVACSAGLAAAARAVPLPSVGWLDDGAASRQASPKEPGPLERTAYAAPRDMAPPPRVTYVPPAIPPSFGDMGDVDVTLRLVLDAQGRVAEARSLETRERDMELPRVRVLDAALLEAVRRWRFAPPAVAPVAMTANVTLVPTARDGTTVFALRERPVPIVLKEAVYPDADEKAGTEGTADVEVTVDAAGRVSGTRLVKATTPAMGDAAIAALEESTFHPGMLDGKPVSVVVTIAVRFALR